MTPERPQIEKPEGDIPFELVADDLTIGEGDEATKGKKVSVHYVGVAFSTGEEFDASWNRGQPFEFKLGVGLMVGVIIISMYLPMFKMLTLVK